MSIFLKRLRSTGLQAQKKSLIIVEQQRLLQKKQKQIARKLLLERPQGKWLCPSSIKLTILLSDHRNVNEGLDKFQQTGRTGRLVLSSGQFSII
jgi:hypothetical protein